MAFLTKLLFLLVFRPQGSALTLRKLPLNYCMMLFLSFRMVCVCWLHLQESAAEWQSGPPMWETLTHFYPTFWLLPWFSSSTITKRVLLLIVWYFLMAKARGNISILHLYCPMLYYFIMLFWAQNNKIQGFLRCIALCGIAFFNMQSRNAVLPLHLYYFIASCVFHVET